MVSQFVLRAAILLALACLLGGRAAWADSRTERPVQIQVDVFGLSAGYHFSQLIFAGVTSQSSYRSARYSGRRYNEDRRVYDQDGIDKARITFGRRDSLEIRFSPMEKYGFYFSFASLVTQGDDIEIQYKEQPRVVGNTAYQSAGLKLEVDGKPTTAPAVGIGINHVFDFGLSVGAGFLMGLKRPSDPDVTVTSFGADPVSEADLTEFADKVRDDYTNTNTGLVHIAVGYNF